MNVPAEPTSTPEAAAPRAGRARLARAALVLAAAGLLGALGWGGLAGYRHLRLAKAERELTATIDRQIEAALAAEKIAPAGEAEDSQFLRRAYLDLTGTLPEVAQTRAFLADPSPDKRRKLVDRLINSRAYAHWLADQWDGYLTFGSGGLVDQIDNRPFTLWLENQFDADVPWDEMTREILTATGRQYQDARVTPYLSARKPEEAASLFGQAFMGVRMNCAQCHDHPHDTITHEAFWSTAAFFDKVNVYSGFEKFTNTEYLYAAKRVGLDVNVYESKTPPKHTRPDRFLEVAPKFLDGSQPRLSGAGDRRPALAAWMTRPGNPWFAKAMVNRIWWQVFGVGLVTPCDDMRASNPATHPELLNELAQAFEESGYNVRFITRAICHTKLYGRATSPEAPPEASQEAAAKTPAGKGPGATYAGVPMKVLSPEQVFESYCQVVGAPPMYRMKFPPQGVELRWEYYSARCEFTRFFDPRGEPAPLTYKQGIPQLLRLMNGSEPQVGVEMVAATKAASKAPARDVIEEFFLAVYARPPREEETKLMLDFLARWPENREAGYRGILWALLNSAEFWMRS